MEQRIKIQPKKILLQAKNLDVYYGTVQALANVSFNVKEGEIVAMIGPNGAGKSTSLKAVCGLLKETGGWIESGEVEFEGESIKELQPFQLVKKGICLVPEGRRVFSTMTVSENLEMGAYTQLSGISYRLSENLDKVFQLFPILKERRRQRAGTLSSGEQQMLAMGRALMLTPKLLLLDEPSLGLSPNYVDDVFDRIEEINRDGTSVLLVEQNARMALEIADRGYVFKIGEIAFENNARNLLLDENIRKTFLGE
ncbi:ABC transporter ATP-binding protein [candidate division WOR-3 bacterium]|nr:ABC transporter ATP-binding protein [candidate division WOR-3 bacterium]